MSLIEFIVASFLGLLLLCGAIGIYGSLKQSDQSIVGLARIQENGRMAIHLLRQEIQSAGYIGCPRLTNLDIPIADTLYPPFTAEYALKDLTKTHSTHDSILIEKADASAYYLISTMPDLKSVLIHPPFKSTNKSWFIISDCSTADVFQINGIVKNRQTFLIIANRPLQKKYNTSATLHQLHAISYFIANTGRKNSSGESISALYRKEFYNPIQQSDEILEGISRMQIHYDIIDDAKHQVRENLTAGEVTAMHAWPKVISVSIALLIDSIEPVFAKPKPYQYQGKSYLPMDRQLHKEWDMTIALQERIG